MIFFPFWRKLFQKWILRTSKLSVCVSKQVSLRTTSTIGKWKTINFENLNANLPFLVFSLKFA
eukprot:UN11958